jgi:Resolvase, N terminal domain
MAWSVDRLGRSLQDLVGFLSELHALKIDLFLRQQGLDTTTPAGKALFQMMGVFAEFERAMIAERVRAGLVRARAEGKRLGRPPIALEDAWLAMRLYLRLNDCPLQVDFPPGTRFFCRLSRLFDSQVFVQSYLTPLDACTHGPSDHRNLGWDCIGIAEKIQLIGICPTASESPFRK